MELPAHHDMDHSGTAGGQQSAPTSSWATVAIVAVVGLLLALVVILHLIGAVGPGGH